MDTLLVYVTFESAEQAKAISKAVVEARLAACANIFPSHESMYWWDGAVQSASETAVIFKTTEGKFETLRDEIVRRHSYQCPCVVALPINAGHEPFLQWISDEVK